MEREVEIFVAVNFFIVGVSHLFQAPAWVDFFRQLRSHGKAGAFVNGMLSLTFGSIIVSFHWVWEGFVPTIVTCIGIAQIIKSFVALALPLVSLRTMHRPMAEKPLGYQVGGAIFLALVGALVYHLWM